MSHDTHAHEHGHSHSHEEKPTIAFRAAFLFVLIVAGLFVASIGFVKSMSHDESADHGGAHTEATHDAHGAAASHEAGHDAAPHGAHGVPAAEGNAQHEAEHTEAAPEAHH